MIYDSVIYPVETLKQKKCNTPKGVVRAFKLKLFLILKIVLLFLSKYQMFCHFDIFLAWRLKALFRVNSLPFTVWQQIFSFGKICDKLFKDYFFNKNSRPFCTTGSYCTTFEIVFDLKRVPREWVGVNCHIFSFCTWLSARKLRKRITSALPFN